MHASQKTVFLFLQTNRRNTLSEEHCIAHQDDKLGFLPNCRYQIVLIGDIDVCYRKWTNFVSHIKTWTVSIDSSSTDSTEKLLPRVDKFLIMCNEQSTSTKETREWTKYRALQKRDSSEKSTRSIY